MKQEHKSIIKEGAATLRALKHQFRQRIITYMLQKEYVTVTELASHFYVSQSLMSQHVAILRRADIISFKREHKFSNYYVNKKRLNNIIEICKQLS